MIRFPLPRLIPAAFLFAGSLWASPMTVQVSEGRQGMVAAGHPSASEAGLQVLRAGGNAMDAAVAVALALGVTEPYGSGMGGKLSLMHYSAADGRVTSVEGLDAAPLGLTAEAYRDAPAEMRGTGPLSVAIPGLPAAIHAAHQKLGSRPWSEVVEPALALARDGFEVTSTQVRFFRSQEAKIKRNPEAARIFLQNGQTVRAGHRIIQPELAATMQLFAARGAAGFYEGPVAESIVAELNRLGSPVSLKDFSGFRANVSEAMTTRFRGYDVHSAPPPVSGGGVFLLTLAVLGDEPIPGRSMTDAAAQDFVMRAFMEADSAGRAVLGDSPNSRQGWAELIRPASVQQLRSALNAPRAPAPVAFIDTELEEAWAAETTHFAVADKFGNVVSATQSLSLHFGSGIIAPGTGVVLNNTLSNFNRIRGNVNEYGPGRRARSTITPTIVLKEGKPRLAIGLPGGSRIPSTMVQVVVDILAFDRPIADAIGAPRFHPLGRGAQGEGPAFETERESNWKTAEDLVKVHGWRNRSQEDVEAFGGINAVEILPDGRLRGYADQRRSNSALGF